MLKLRSVSNIVIAPARTGRDSSSKNTVTKILHTNRFTRSIVMPGDRMLKIVVIKLIAPKIEDIPARCSEKITRSTEAPAWAIGPLNGG